MPAKKKIDTTEVLAASDEVQKPETNSEEPTPEKPKRRTRKKTAETETTEMPTNTSEIEETSVNMDSMDKILTIDANSKITTEETEIDIAWHEIQNAFKTRRIISGILSGIERNEASQYYAIADYKGFRIIIPLKEMFFEFPTNLHGDEYKNTVIAYHKLMNSMLGAEIDFIIKGIDIKSKSVVASRKEAMSKKRQTFYMDTDKNGVFHIHEERIVQVRVIAVAEKAIRVEIFGVDCTIPVKDLSWEWIGDARERFFVGDQILVRIKEIKRESIKDLYVYADVKSVFDNRSANLELCKIQGKYAGRITDIHKGVVYIRLNNGVNAIAHSCLDRRMPGKKDDVSFAVTSLDKTKCVALGIITRIIKQNI